MAEIPVQLPLDFQRRLLALMTADEIFDTGDADLLQRLREDRRVERKPGNTHCRALGDYFSMWANTAPDGGIIVLGLEDDGRVSGCRWMSENALNDLEQAGRIHCPDARYKSRRVAVIRPDGSEDFLLLIRVFYRRDRVVETSQREVFVRLGDSKTRLTREVIRELEIDKGQVDLEQDPSGLLYPEDFNLSLVRQYTDQVKRIRGLLPNHEDTEILEQRFLGKRVAGRFTPNVACALLFSKDPREKFPGARIRFLRFDGEHEGTGERFNALKDIWIEGPIPLLIVEAEQVLSAQIRQFSRLGPDGKFYTADEYPKLAWYEAVVNACVHRSYNLRNMNIFIKMFSNRLVVESPGPFPPLVNEVNIYDVHHPRNPNLMEGLFHLDFVKCANEGTRRMRDSMREMSLPLPEFQEKQSEVGYAIVRVTLRNNIRDRKPWVDTDAIALVGAAVLQNLTREEREAVNFVAANGKITVNQVQRFTGKSWQAAKNVLLRLVEKKILEAIKRPGLQRDPQAHFVLRSDTNKT